MAHSSSGDLTIDQTYTTGQYTFSLSRQYDSESDTTYLTADCSYGADAGIKQITIDGDALVESWSVEISDNTADIYANVKMFDLLITGDLNCMPIPARIHEENREKGLYHIDIEDPNGDACPEGGYATIVNYNGMYDMLIIAWREDENVQYHGFWLESYIIDKDGKERGASGGTSYGTHRWSIKNKHVAYGRGQTFWSFDITKANLVPHSDVELSDYAKEKHYNFYNCVAWSMVYSAHKEDGRWFVARFQIVPEDADPGSWDDPIDDGDPEYVLKVAVHGALSGRHNDPLLLSPHSYTPSDNTTVKEYGCGGDGGHGGGGGGGASTVIINRFNTSRAGSHESYAYARRHGYGSGGGKGGKGGDGCIIIYY